MPDAAGAPAGLDLAVDGLVVRGEGGRVLLDVPRLRVPAGSALAGLGAPGAGKSTLLHALAGLLRPAAGRVLWGGQDLAALSEDARARFRRERLGLVFQDFLLFEELDALGNAAVAAGFAPRAARPGLVGRAGAWLGRLGLGDRAGRAVRTFSGGERQRVVVARALGGDPAAPLADELTASLDRAAADRLAGDLAALAGPGGRTLVVASHDGGLAARLGRVVTLEAGRVVEDGGG